MAQVAHPEAILSPTQPSLQEILEERRNLACLQFVVVLDLVKPTIQERLVIPDIRYLHRMEVADNELMFACHSLNQCLHPDTPNDDEVAWIPVAEQGFKIVAKEIKKAKRFAKSPLFGEGFLAENRLDFHRMLHSIRTRNGSRVLSPYGEAFATDASTGEVNIPETVAITVEDIAKIPGDSILKRQLLERVR